MPASSSSICDVVVGSSALVASSHSRYDGSVASALAIATRCFCPPDSCDGYAPALSDSPTVSSSSPAFATASFRGVPAISSGKSTFPSAVRCESRLKLWNIMPIFFRVRSSSFRLMAVRSRPSTSTCPDVGLSSRFMHRTSVLFPAPDRPIIPKISPSPIVRSMPESAVIPPSGVGYVFVRSLISII